MIFNETIQNVKKHFISHKTKIFNNREPPRINNKVKTNIKKHNKYVKWQKSFLHPAYHSWQQICYRFYLKRPISLIRFFAKQYSIVEDNSLLPSSADPITDQYLLNIEFTKDDIKRTNFKVIPNKAQGYDIVFAWWKYPATL